MTTRPTPGGDMIAILLAHDRWATHKMLDAAASLTDEQLHQKFEIGLGSLHDSLVHNIGAIQGWADILAQRAPRPWIDPSKRSVATLRSLFDEAAADFAVAARIGPPEQELIRERNGVTYRYTRAGIITHVATHGVHHRAQMLNMLRRLGVSPLPESSVVEWSRAGMPG